MIASILIAAALAANVPPNLLLAICWTESNHRAEAINVYDGGSASYGMCQVKLATAKGIDRYATPLRLLEPHYNARIASRILAKHIRRYHGSWACGVVSYNRGNCCGRFDNCDNITDNKYYRKVVEAIDTKPWKGANE